jgi:hypothetical protein
MASTASIAAAVAVVGAVIAVAFLPSRARPTKARTAISPMRPRPAAGTVGP